ncbi:hypothetical protein BT96DRAFT_937710 [Gymnopus androsaceus JB14]|uniref:Uncharacterized protein n=1 Tax=Gymnopus androsaceus JB14 TaxID=1447944 RepID=A0A6A4HXK8_9AGAR|nr:hypothetical protein BT96DRAFT_937710 [Gymnopus androsaceus JB14]
MVVSLQRNLQSLRILTLEGGPLVTKAGSWLDPEFLEKDQMRRSKAETTVSTRAQLDMLSLKGLNLSGTELEPFLRILFNTDPWSTFDVSGLRRLEITFSIYSNHLMDYGSLLKTVGSTLRHLELSLKTDESIRQWLIVYVTRMMAEVPVLTGFRDVVKQLRQLQFFSLTCEDSLPAIHNIIDHLSLLSSLEDVQITLITPGLDLMLLTPNFDASLASIIDANAGMNTITIRFQYHFESISYIQRGVSLLEEVPGVVDTSGTGILEEYLPLTSKMVSVRLLRAFGT